MTSGDTSEVGSNEPARCSADCCGSRARGSHRRALAAGSYTALRLHPSACANPSLIVTVSNVQLPGTAGNGLPIVSKVSRL